MDDQSKRKREDGGGDAGSMKRMKEDSGAMNRIGPARRGVPVVVKTEQAKAAAMQGKRGEISTAEIQKHKKAALAQAERATGHFTGFDSPYGNYLIPSLPMYGSK